MQKKRWWIDKDGIHEVNECNDCSHYDSYTHPRNIDDSYHICFATKKESLWIEHLVKECPLIEAETKEEAFEKIWEIFNASNKD